MSPKEQLERVAMYRRLFQEINDKATALETLISCDRGKLPDRFYSDLGSLENHASDARISADDAMKDLDRAMKRLMPETSG